MSDFEKDNSKIRQIEQAYFYYFKNRNQITLEDFEKEINSYLVDNNLSDADVHIAISKVVKNKIQTEIILTKIDQIHSYFFKNIILNVKINEISPIQNGYKDRIEIQYRYLIVEDETGKSRIDIYLTDILQKLENFKKGDDILIYAYIQKNKTGCTIRLNDLNLKNFKNEDQAYQLNEITSFSKISNIFLKIEQIREIKNKETTIYYYLVYDETNSCILKLKEKIEFNKKTVYKFSNLEVLLLHNKYILNSITDFKYVPTSFKFKTLITFTHKNISFLKNNFIYNLYLQLKEWKSFSYKKENDVGTIICDRYIFVDGADKEIEFIDWNLKFYKKLKETDINSYIEFKYVTLSEYGFKKTLNETYFTELL